MQDVAPAGDRIDSKAGRHVETQHKDTGFLDCVIDRCTEADLVEANVKCIPHHGFDLRRDRLGLSRNHEPGFQEAP